MAPLGAAWYRFLDSLPWHHFITLTFAEDAWEYRCHNSLKWYYRSLREHFGEVALFYVLEPHKWRESLHIHALAQYGDRLWVPRRKDVKALWKWGHAKVYDVVEEASAYMIKYVAKGKAVDWGILGSPRADRVAKS